MSFERFVSAYSAASIPTRSQVLMNVRARAKADGHEPEGLYRTGNGSTVLASLDCRAWMPALVKPYRDDAARLAVLMDAARAAGMLS